jgi:ornithine carbamoyltransferase
MDDSSMNLVAWNHREGRIQSQMGFKKRTGVLEYRSDGVMVRNKKKTPNTPLLQYSNTPILNKKTRGFWPRVPEVNQSKKN